MLVLTRRSGESVQVGEAITVKVLSISGNQVKLGFSAPAEVPIRREELLASIAVPLNRCQQANRDEVPLSRAVC